MTTCEAAISISSSEKSGVDSEGLVAAVDDDDIEKDGREIWRNES